MLVGQGHRDPGLAVGGGAGAGCTGTGPLPGAPAALTVTAPPSTTTRVTASKASALPRVMRGSNRQRGRSPACWLLPAGGGASNSRQVSTGRTRASSPERKPRSAETAGARRRPDVVSSVRDAMIQAPTMPLRTVTTSGASAANAYPIPAALKAVLAFSISPGSPPPIT